MSQAMYTAVSGISANQAKLNVISNNLANVNTLGFKSSNANFATVFASTLSEGSAPNGLLGGTNPRQIGNGTSVSEIASNWSQGGNEYTGRNTDLMINGNGFFVIQKLNVNNGAQSTDFSLTRAGNFSLDANGNLVTSAGDRIRGSSLIDNSTTATLGLVNIPQKFTVTKDINASSTITAIHLSPLNTTTAIPAAPVGGSQSTVDVSLTSFSIGQDGSISAKYSNGDLLTVRIDPSSPTSRELVYKVPGVGDFSVSNSAGDQGPLNQVADVGVPPVFDGGTGLGIGTGSNNGMDGRQMQIQMASVTNPQGLVYSGNNKYEVGANSGTVQFGAGNIGSRGTVQAGALESSNVDMAGQFADMVITQRGLEASTKIIQAQSQVMQTIIQMV